MLHAESCAEAVIPGWENTRAGGRLAVAPLFLVAPCPGPRKPHEGKMLLPAPHPRILSSAYRFIFVHFLGKCKYRQTDRPVEREISIVCTYIGTEYFALINLMYYKVKRASCSLFRQDCAPLERSHLWRALFPLLKSRDR